MVSTRHDLVGAPYREELSRLQHQVEPVPVEAIVAWIEESLGVDIASHPVSVILTPRGQVALVDLGMVASLSPKMRPGACETPPP